VIWGHLNCKQRLDKHVLLVDKRTPANAGVFL
jgi:hypothetical protein